MKRTCFINILLFTFFVILGSGELSAQQFKASVDKTTVGQNERFQVYFEFSGSDINSLSNFRNPSFNGFKVLSGPNQSTNMQIINGQVSASLTYTYVVAATEIGEFTIGSASIESKGTEYKTDPIKIKVVQGTTQPQQQSTDESVSFEEIAKNLFIRAEADKNTAYKGEQVTVTYKLFSALNISSPQITKLPQYKGFWAEELESVNNLQWQIEMYNGRRYRVALLKRVALFPTQSGELSVTPFELTIPVIVQRKRQSRDIFDEFFNDSFFGRRQSVDFPAESNTLKINVRELPEDGKPESFNGAVGDLDFSAKLDKTEGSTNEPITITVSLSGKGNIKLLDVPKLNLPPGFEQYEPKTTENITRKNIVSGIKTAEYLIVPRVPGTKQIPSIEFSYFNPATKKYITKRSSPYTLNIRRGESDIQSSVSGFSKEDIKLLSEDVRFIKTSDFNLQKIDKTRLVKSWFWISLVIPFIAFIGFIGLKKRQDKISGNIQLLKYQKAEKIARSRLKSAKKALEAGDIAKFHAEISVAIYGYLEDKLNLEKAEFTTEKALRELKNRNVNDELIHKVRSTLDKCEFIRFAPQMSNKTESGELHESTVKLIVELENSILLRKI
ncbi:MAG: BatD family protein [Melioribacteraceae bacterium]|nr:BatD family protein [Melioribacteraceae bacterium]